MHKETQMPPKAGVKARLGSRRVRFAARPLRQKPWPKPALKPDRVLGGGVDGALALSGDGSQRSDRIAVIAGPRGPVAEAELQAEEPGLSANTLDAYAKRLGAEAAEDLATRPG